MDNWGIGDFDTRVRLQRCEITTGDTGEKIYNWKCVRDVFAKVESVCQRSSSLMPGICIRSKVSVGEAVLSVSVRIQQCWSERQ